MFCRNCGSRITEGAEFCGECGSRITAAPAAQPVQQAAMPAAQPAQPSTQARQGKRKTGLVVALVILVAIICIAGAFVAMSTAKGDGDYAVAFYELQEPIEASPATHIVVYGEDDKPLDVYDFTLVSAETQERTTYHIEGDQGITMSDLGVTVAGTYHATAKSPTAENAVELPDIIFNPESDDEGTYSIKIEGEGAWRPDNKAASAESDGNEEDAENQAEEEPEEDYIHYIEAYKPVIMEFVAQTKDQNGPWGSYGLYDMDEDGMSELLIQMYTCEADKTVHVYTIGDDNTAKKLGTFEGWHSGYCEYGGNGLYRIYQGPVGSEGGTYYATDLVSIENGKLVSETVAEDACDSDTLDSSSKEPYVTLRESRRQPAIELLDFTQTYVDYSPLRVLENRTITSTITKADEGVVIDNDYFTATLPASWTGKVTFEENTIEYGSALYNIDVVYKDTTIATLSVNDVACDAWGDVGGGVFWEEACDKESCYVQLSGGRFVFLFGDGDVSEYESLPDADKEEILSLVTGGEVTLDKAKAAGVDWTDEENGYVVSQKQDTYFQEAIAGNIALK